MKPENALKRRDLLAYAAFGSAAIAATASNRQASAADETAAPRRRYGMNKSINLWEFP